LHGVVLAMMRFTCKRFSTSWGVMLAVSKVMMPAQTASSVG
jgi:hypothetical protein